MADKAVMVGVAGGALIVANFATNGQGSAIWNVIWTGTERKNTQDMHNFLMELLLLGILVFAAGFSDAAANVILLIMVGLWFAWLLRRYGGGAKG